MNPFFGFADEAADGIEGQIRATRSLGWNAIELRRIDGAMLCELADDIFERTAGALATAGISVPCLGSGIGNNTKRLDDPEEPGLAEIKRLLPRMRYLGTRMVRVMSWKLILGQSSSDQLVAERIRRLREIAVLCADAGITLVHENCRNWGGAGWRQSLQLIESVPGMKLVFDMGNAVRDIAIDEPAYADGGTAQMSPWEFYRRVREHVVHVHLKDACIKADGSAVWCWPGEGHADLVRIITDLLARGYQGAFSIEPHLGTASHQGVDADTARLRMYIEYGFRAEALVARARAVLAAQGVLPALANSTTVSSQQVTCT